MSHSIRVRFAPSPTGAFHVGSARTALFNWLYARHCGGTFVLRIEDTDAARNTKESLAALIDGMRWLGLDWDEGPDVGGTCGPYFQSQRGDVYRDHIERLKRSGHAYEKEGAWWFRLAGERRVEFDPHLKREVEKVAAAPQVIEDLIRGRVERAEERDFVIVRADGEPVFHLVNVVDDLTMGITHVIRGEDHLSNTSKHCELFRALGAEPPIYAHIPLILKSTGKGKMSKRDEGALLEQYMAGHFLPAAVMNYLALLGWSPKDDREVFSPEELVNAFDFAGVAASNAKFDHDKLVHLNALHLRRLPAAEFAEQARAVLPSNLLAGQDAAYVAAVLELAQPKVNRLADLVGLIGHFFQTTPDRDPEVAGRLTRKGDPLALLAALRQALAGVDAGQWNDAALDVACAAAAERLDRKKTDAFPLLRYAVSGAGGGPDLLPLLRILGRDRVLNRLNDPAIDAALQS